MQKKLLWFAMTLMAALLIPALSACGGDDDDSLIDSTKTDSIKNNSQKQTDDDVPASLKELILGTWEGCVDKYEGTVCTITFKNNGTFSEVDVFSGGTIDSDGTYTIDSGILTLEGDYSQLINANAFTFVIVECTSEHLVLTPFYAKNGSQFYYDNITLTRK
jgi:hypothetical protein